MPVLASRRIAAYRSTLDFGNTRAPSSCRAQPWSRSKHRGVSRTQRHHSPVEPGVPAAEHQTFLKLTYRASLSSDRGHDRYRCRLKDLPLAEQGFVIRLTVRRPICGAADCPRRTFAEQFSRLAAPYARFTTLLTRALQRVGLALAGRADARPAAQLASGAGRMTLLREVMALPDPRSVSPTWLRQPRGRARNTSCARHPLPTCEPRPLPGRQITTDRPVQCRQRRCVARRKLPGRAENQFSMGRPPVPRSTAPTAHGLQTSS